MSYVESPHQKTAQPSSTVATRPVSAPDDHERELVVVRAVLAVITAWRSFGEGSERLLRELAGALGQMAGALWIPDRDRLAMRMAWSRVGFDPDGWASAIGGLRVRRGIGLAGGAWEQLEAIDRVASEPHRLSRRRGSPQDLEATLAIPCATGGEVLAVVELYSHAKPELSGQLMQALTQAGRDLGAFLAHRRGELGLSPLTPRELEVLTLAGQGLAVRGIAESLAISAPTVKTHLGHIYRKLEARDRTTAVARALRAGLIE